MVKVITYGTFDMFHYGHQKLLERAKALGDYLVVGVTSDDFDKRRGKINNQQSLMERIASVKKTGLADEIVVEEYEGQKIDDIHRLDIDIFTVGSDWEGYFDYLEEYCKVIYLPRTKGVSSTEVRSEHRKIRLGIVGSTNFSQKFIKECSFVNGVEVVGIINRDNTVKGKYSSDLIITDDYDDLLKIVDAVYVVTKPEHHYRDSKRALVSGKHVICESPIAYSRKEADDLFCTAKEKKLIIIDAIKTAYSTAYERLVLLAKSGAIGDAISIEATRTSLRTLSTASEAELSQQWNSICGWAPAAMLPIFQLFGTEYKDKVFYTRFLNKEHNIDGFSKIDFIFRSGVASIKVGKGVKSEGELIISGTNGYIYVPAPWWKTDYFEIRYENPEKNRRFFYQLDGEGIRQEIVTFVKSIASGKNMGNITEIVSRNIVGVVEDFNARKNLIEI